MLTQSSNSRILPEDSIPTKSGQGRNLKILTLGFLSATSLIAAFALIERAIYSDQPLVFWAWPAGLIVVGIVFLTLFAITNSNRLFLGLFAAIPMIAYVYLFPKNLFALIGGAGFLLFMIWFEQRIRSEEKSRQDFSIYRITSGSVGLMIYAFLLLLGLNIYNHTSEEFKSNPNRFYNQLGQSVVRSSQFLSGEHIGIDFNQSLDEYLQTQVEEASPDFEQLPESQKQQMLAQARDSFFERFDINISPDRPLVEILAQVAVERIQTTAQNFQPLFPLIFTLIILALLRTFAFVFRWLAVALTWLVYRLLLLVKFFRTSKVLVEVEKLEI
jgi:hypothetical protein